jgi:hypothetical protein
MTATIDHLDGAIEALHRKKFRAALDHIQQFRHAASPATHPDLVEAGQLLSVAADLVAQEHFELAAADLRRATLIVNRHTLSQGWRSVNGLPWLLNSADGLVA